MKLRRRKPEPAIPEMRLRITSPDCEGGPLVDVGMNDLYVNWRMGERSYDGWLEVFPGVGFASRSTRIRVWVRPVNYVEPPDDQKPAPLVEPFRGAWS